MSFIKKPASRYTNDWSARIEFLKKTLTAETQMQNHDRGQEPPAPGPQQKEADAPKVQMLSDGFKNLEHKNTALTEQMNHLQETSAHETRKLAKKCQELEEFVKVKEIDLQNLKSDSVEHRLIHDEIKKRIDEQSRKWKSEKEELEKKLQDLTDLIVALKSQIQETRLSQEAVKIALPPDQAPAPIKTDPDPFVVPTDTAQVSFMEISEEKTFLQRLIAWWNEPVTKISVPKKD